MSGLPRLSVIMPLHRGEATLDATLASLPSDARIEIIALDSSPSDSCHAIVQRHAARIAVTYRHMPQTPSWTVKTNAAVVMARGTHIAMLHQDDLWLPGRFDRMIAAMDADPDAALILSAATIIDAQGRTLGRWRCPLTEQTHWDGRVVATRLLVQNFVAIAAPVLRRDLWLDLGGLDETLWYTPDWDLWIKAALKGMVRYIAEPTVAFRVHAGSQTVRGSDNAAAFLAQMDAVAARYMPLLCGEDTRSTSRIARASARINTHLAQAMHGRHSAILPVLGELLRLSPSEMRRYFHQSRIVERVLPRLRAGLARTA